MIIMVIGLLLLVLITGQYAVFVFRGNKTKRPSNNHLLAVFYASDLDLGRDEARCSYDRPCARGSGSGSAERQQKMPRIFTDISKKQRDRKSGTNSLNTTTF